MSLDDALDYEQELREAFEPTTEEFTVPTEWEGFPGIAFGGFVAGAVLVAAAARSEKPRPLSFFSRFYRPVPIGRPVKLSLASERSGRTVETLTARLNDGERLLATFSAAYGRDGDATLTAQSVKPMSPLARPQPIWQHLESIGLEPSNMMRRVGFRGETDGGENDPADDWHLRSEWPASVCKDPAVQAAVAIMAIDSFVGPATMRANQRDLDGEWPVTMPSLDLTSWFYRPEAGCQAGEWLRTRTSVPATGAGYAVGRTQVWAGDVLMAEGMSQVALIPMPGASA